MSDREDERQLLGTAQEEFDIATGYWNKWQRCQGEKEELLEVAKELDYVTRTDGFTYEPKKKLREIIRRVEGE